VTALARFETWVDCDLKKAVMMHFPAGLMFNEDSLGNLIGVNVYSDGEPVTLSGSVVGYCILANGSSIPVSGTRTSNKAYIVMPEVAYTVPGLIVIVLKLTDGDATTTLAAVSATVLGIGNVPADPSPETIEQWTAQINAVIEELENGSVRFDASQTLTAEQKNTARGNIGANTEAVLLSGEDYKIVVP
jgi:hypothetical protein